MAHYDREVRLHNRQLLLIGDLVVLQLERLGVDVPTDLLREARESLSHRKVEELQALLARLDDERMDRFRQWSQENPE